MEVRVVGPLGAVVPAAAAGAVGFRLATWDRATRIMNFLIFAFVWSAAGPTLEA